MDKNSFYSELSGKLAAIGVEEEYINRQISQFESYFAGKTDEQIAKDIERLGDLDKAAERIKRMAERSAEKEDAADSDVTDQSAASDNNGVSAQDPAVASDEVEVSEKSEQPAEEIAVDINAESSSSVIDNEDDDVKTVSRHDNVKKAAISNEEIKNNTKKFRILLGVTSPISLLALFLIASGFMFAYLIIAFVMIFAIGATIGIIGVGSIVTIGGVIFSVFQITSSLPLGLYEMGLAVLVGSLSSVTCILLYNFAVRLMPYAAKKLLVFVKYVIRKLRELYVHLKKECIGL